MRQSGASKTRMSEIGTSQTPITLTWPEPRFLLVHPMLPIELHKVPELLSGVSGIVPQETHDSNRNDGNNCEYYCRDHKEQ
jgi:hypothetical protein